MVSNCGVKGSSLGDQERNGGVSSQLSLQGKKLITRAGSPQSYRRRIEWYQHRLVVLADKLSTVRIAAVSKLNPKHFTELCYSALQEL